MSLSSLAKRQLAEELKRDAHYKTILNQKISIENQGKQKGIMRLVQMEKNETQEAFDTERATERAAYREKSLNEEETLAREMEKLKKQEICAVLERQRLRENSHELRELDRKLKAAYTKRELIAQMAENAEIKRLEQKRNLDFNKILQEARLDEAEYDKHIKQTEILKKHEYRKELQEQMIMQEKMKRSKYEELLREKKQIDQVVERIHLEDERMLQEKWMKMQKTKAEMESFKEAREIWKRKQKEEVELENKKIQEYMFAKQSDAQAKGIEKRTKEEIKERIMDQMAKSIYEERTKQREKEDIQQELLEQEYIEAQDQREKNDIEKKNKQRIEMVEGLDNQVKEHEISRQKAAEDDAYFRKLIDDNILEQEELEMLTEEKKRIRKIQLRKDLQDLIFERRQKHAENMQVLLTLHEQELEEMSERNKKIEEERMRMLKEHAEHLVGYMPKGILREDDLEILGRDVYEMYKPKEKLPD